MRVFSQINNCQQKQNKKQKQKTDKTKRGAPLLGLAKSIDYKDSLFSRIMYSESNSQQLIGLTGADPGIFDSRGP